MSRREAFNGSNYSLPAIAPEGKFDSHTPLAAYRFQSPRSIGVSPDWGMKKPNLMRLNPWSIIPGGGPIRRVDQEEYDENGDLIRRDRQGRPIKRKKSVLDSSDGAYLQTEVNKEPARTFPEGTDAFGSTKSYQPDAFGKPVPPSRNMASIEKRNKEMLQGRYKDGRNVSDLDDLHDGAQYSSQLPKKGRWPSGPTPPEGYNARPFMGFLDGREAAKAAGLVLPPGPHSEEPPVLSHLSVKGDFSRGRRGRVPKWAKDEAKAAQAKLDDSLFTVPEPGPEVDKSGSWMEDSKSSRNPSGNKEVTKMITNAGVSNDEDTEEERPSRRRRGDLTKPLTREYETRGSKTPPKGLTKPLPPKGPLY